MAILDRDGVVDLDDIPPTLGGETGQAVASALWDLTANGIDFPTAVERFERALIGTAMRPPATTSPRRQSCWAWENDPNRQNAKTRIVSLCGADFPTSSHAS
jgi:hypothetical protein